MEFMKQYRGKKSRNSYPGFKYLLILTGSSIQSLGKQIASRMIAANNNKREGTLFSIIGANHKAAKNPNTTEGREAIISIVGLTIRRQAGFKNSAV